MGMSRHANSIQGDGQAPAAVRINLKSCGLTSHQTIPVIESATLALAA